MITDAVGTRPTQQVGVMSEQARFWIAFALSAIGAAFLALLTIDPQIAIHNLQGWLALVPRSSTADQPSTTAVTRLFIAIISALIGLVAAFAAEHVTDRRMIQRLRNDLNLSKGRESRQTPPESDDR